MCQISSVFALIFIVYIIILTPALQYFAGAFADLGGGWSLGALEL